MLHTLVSHIFNIFVVFASNVNDPNLICEVKYQETIDFKPYDVLAYLYKELLQHFKIVCVASTLGNLFAKSPLTYLIFFIKPTTTKKLPGENDSDKNIFSK